jgi:hypothetical protein
MMDVILHLSRAHPSERWWRRFHGRSAFVFLFGLGAALPIHIQHVWHSRKKSQSGLTFCTVSALLITCG